jgi:hypothetical protein
VAVGLAVLLPLALGEGVPLGLAAGAGVVVPVYGSMSSTGRNASCAFALIRATVLAAALPGTVTVIWSSPCVWTCAPELPVPFTRLSRTPMDACISAADGG